MTDLSNNFAGDLADIPDFLADDRHTLAVIDAVDPALLDLVGLVLVGQDAVIIRTELHFGADDDGTSSSTADDDLARLVSHSSVEDSDDEPVRLDAPMPSTRPTYSLREVLTTVAQDRAVQDPGGTAIILLPATIELAHLLSGLTEELTDTDVRLAGAAHVLDATTALGKLLEHRQLSALPGDTRCTGTVRLTNLGYADLALTLERGEDPAGANLIEHLHPHDALLLPGPDTPFLETLTTLTHDIAAFLNRTRPAATSAWGGPSEYGAWTLGLDASLPFHPERLRFLIVELTGQGLYACGYFWLSSHPGRVCTWEVAGGAVSVDDVGIWAEVPATPPGTDDSATGKPHSHLVVTGVGDGEMHEQVRHAFSRILLRPEEAVQALAWVGANDNLGDWFGQEG